MGGANRRSKYVASIQVDLLEYLFELLINAEIMTFGLHFCQFSNIICD